MNLPFLRLQMVIKLRSVSPLVDYTVYPVGGRVLAIPFQKRFF